MEGRGAPKGKIEERQFIWEGVKDPKILQTSYVASRMALVQPALVMRFLSHPSGCLLPTSWHPCHVRAFLSSVTLTFLPCVVCPWDRKEGEKTWMNYFRCGKFSCPSPIQPRGFWSGQRALCTFERRLLWFFGTKRKYFTNNLFRGWGWKERAFWNFAAAYHFFDSCWKERDERWERMSTSR